MYLEDLEGFAILKNLFLEPFKGGVLSTRKKNKEITRPYLSIFAFFIVLYTFTYIYFSSSGFSHKLLK
jgi:hypothetical protein